MFKTDKYKIVFKRIWHYLDETKAIKNGRYDTKCEIYIDDETQEVPRFTGIAKLHPNDQVDRVIGKKIALTEAMIEKYQYITLPNGTVTKEPIYWVMFWDKEKRAKIWKAFWAWVASWKEKKEPCPACEILPQLFDEINKATKNEKEN